jgi:hypothetical protein
MDKPYRLVNAIANYLGLFPMPERYVITDHCRTEAFRAAILNHFLDQ